MEENELEAEQSSESLEEQGLASGRERRQIKPNLMDDHIYFVKRSKTEQTQPPISKSQLRAKRLAKQAAKEFEKQKLKVTRSTPKIDTQVDFSKYSLADDDVVSNSIN